MVAQQQIYEFPQNQTQIYKSYELSYDPESYYATYPEQYSIHQSYYYPDNSSPVNPNSILLPGVPLSLDSQPTQLPISCHYHFQAAQPVYAGGSQGCRPTRGRRGGTFGCHEAGRGGGRCNHASSQTSVSATIHTVDVAPSKPQVSVMADETLSFMAHPSEEGVRHGSPSFKGRLNSIKVAPSKPQVSVMADGTVSSISHQSEKGVRHDSPSFRGGLNNVEVTPSKAPPKVAWCECCWVVVPTPQLELHKKGKKHLRKELKEKSVCEERTKNISKQLTVQNQQPEAPQVSVAADETISSIVHPSVEGVAPDSPFRGSLNNVEAAPSKLLPKMTWCKLCGAFFPTCDLEEHEKGKKHLRRERKEKKVCEEMKIMSSCLTAQNQQPEAPQVSVMADKTVSSMAHPSEEGVRRDSPLKGGLKRKMRGDHENDVFERPFQPSKKRKQMVLLVCELCNMKFESQLHYDAHLAGKKHLSSLNRQGHKVCELCHVKCESQFFYDSHMAGKKHLLNMKRYQGHKKVFGENTEALCPTMPNLRSTSVGPQSTSVTHEANQHTPQDAQELASVLLSNQNLPDPQALQSSLTQLLNQHGIHDAQTLIAKLTSNLLTQGSVPFPVADLGTNAPCPQSQGSIIPSIAAGQNSGQ